MKKIFGLAIISMLALGSFGVSFASPGGECSAPVDANCTVTNADGSTTPCTLYISAGTPADGCN